MNLIGYAGFYERGKLYTKDGAEFICNFGYRIYGSEPVKEEQKLQGVGTATEILIIEVCGDSNPFKPRMKAILNNTEYRIFDANDEPQNIYGNNKKIILIRLYKS